MRHLGENELIFSMFVFLCLSIFLTSVFFQKRCKNTKEQRFWSKDANYLFWMHMRWVWLWCCVWAVVCQLRLVWFLCKNILSRSVCQEARWTHRPMRSSDDPVWPIRSQRELCLRCGEMFGLNLALFEFLRLYPRFYQVLSSTCDISWHFKSVSFAHLSWLTFLRQNMIRRTITMASRIPQMTQSAINKPSFVFSFIINS